MGPPDDHFIILCRADLSPAFNWNIKQLFVFLVAEYKTSKNVRTTAKPRPRLLWARPR
jgi:hypothetical protein